MSFRLTGRLTTDFLPPESDADFDFDVTYSEDDGWPDPSLNRVLAGTRRPFMKPPETGPNRSRVRIALPDKP